MLNIETENQGTQKRVVENQVTQPTPSIYQTSAKTFVDAWLDAFMNKPSQNINPYVRWEMFLVGSVFMAVTFDIQSYLNWLVLLPLFSIYLFLTAITGYEPLYELIRRAGIFLHKHSLIPKMQPMSGAPTAFAGKH